MIVTEACRIFVNHCIDERRLSVNTIAAYRQDAKEFCLQHGNAAVAAVSGSDLVAYASYLRNERRLAHATVKRRIAFLKGLFGWLQKRREILRNPFHEIDLRVRVPDRLPRCLDPGDARSLLMAADSARTAISLVVRLLLATGMRVGELATLRVGDVDLTSGTLRIIGKGDRERRVFLANQALNEDLRLYLRTHRSAARSNDCLLATGTGGVSRATWIRSKLRGLAHAAGIERRVTPHMLRHTAATTLVESGVDVRFVQKLLGHRSICTTQMYTHVSDTALKEAVTRADICLRLAT